MNSKRIHKCASFVIWIIIATLDALTWPLLCLNSDYYSHLFKVKCSSSLSKLVEPASASVLRITHQLDFRICPAEDCIPKFTFVESRSFD